MIIDVTSALSLTFLVHSVEASSPSLIGSLLAEFAHSSYVIVDRGLSIYRTFEYSRRVTSYIDKK